MSPSEKPRIIEFERAALPHFRVLYRTAAKVVHDQMQTEDVVQETFLQAWESFHRFEPGTNCRAWLFKILFRVIHRERLRALKTGLTGDLGMVPSDYRSYVPPVPDGITDETFLQALERVPGAFRKILLLVDVEEFSYREVAQSLRIPLGTVMSRLSRGRRIFRASLQSLGKSQLKLAVQ